MLRHVLAFALFLLPCCSSGAADEQVIHDCDYWRLGKDNAEKAKGLAACDRIIKDKHFAPADRAMAYAERAGFAANESRNDDAIADLDQALALSPLAPDANTLIGWRRTRADLLHFKGLHDRAIEDYDKVLAANPDGHITFFRGLSYLGKGDETRAFADFAKAIELAPDDYWLRYRRGLEYAKRGQADAALADVDKAIALKNDDRDSYLLRAELYTKKGDTEKAIADLTRAAEVAPEYGLTPYSNRALLYEQTGQYDRALADYDKLLSLSPASPYYTNRRAALMEKLARERSVLQGAWNFIKRIYNDFTFDPTAPLVVPSPPKPIAPPAEAPLVKAPAPVPEVEKAEPSPAKDAEPAPLPKEISKPAIAGKGECRRFDAIANMTIAVACPD